jgi:hypothetical protein
VGIVFDYEDAGFHRVIHADFCRRPDTTEAEA